MRSVVIVASLLFMLGIVALLLAWPRSTARVTAAPGTSAWAESDVHSLRRRVQELEGAIARLDRVRPAQGVSVDPKKDSERTRANAEAVEDILSPEAEARRLEEGKKKAALAVDLLDAHLKAEGVDPSWSRSTEDEIRTQFATMPKLFVDRIECRSTICRTDVVSDEQGAESILAQTPTPTNGAKVGIALRFETPDGRWRTTIFHGREATSFPTLP